MAKDPAGHGQQPSRSLTYTIMFLGTFVLAAIGMIVAILGFFGFGSATQFTASSAEKIGGIQTTSVGLAIMFIALAAMVVLAINKPQDVQPFALERKSTPQRFVDAIGDRPLPLAIVTALVLVLLVIRFLVH